MKILWLSQNLPYPPTWGVLQRNYYLLRETCNEHEVYLIAFNQRNLLPTAQEQAEAIGVLEKMCRRVEVVEVPSDRTRYHWYVLVLKSLFTVHPYGVNWLKSQAMRSKIKEITGNIKFDMAYYDTIGLAEYFPDIEGIPKILNHHNIESALMRRRSLNEKNIIKKIYLTLEAVKLERYEKMKCRKFHSNIVVSELDKISLQILIPNLNVTVIPNGVDLEYFRPLNDQIIENSLTFAAPMSWFPNSDAVLFFCREIWPILKREIPGIRFTLIGSSPPKEVVQMARTDKGILLTGFIDDVRPDIGRAAVYICPLRIGGGTRLKILNALAMEKAVVSTSIGCEGLKVTHGKNILIADTPHDFADQIKKVLKDKELRASLGHEGRILVEKRYSWRYIGETLRELCRSVKRYS